jgi:hypothetical protein
VVTAFPLRKNSLKPYGNSNLTIKHGFFDSCLSSENACGVLISRFCVWKGHKPDTVDLRVHSSFTICTDDLKCPIMCVFYQDALIPKMNSQMNLPKHMAN